MYKKVAHGMRSYMREVRMGLVSFSVWNASKEEPDSGVRVSQERNPNHLKCTSLTLGDTQLCSYLTLTIFAILSA